MKELENLYEFISSKVDLNDYDKKLIEESVEIEKYKKGDKLVKLNQTCKSIKFVISGIYRMYKLDKGREITSYFSYKFRNPFVASFVSLLTTTPSNEIVECIESGELISIQYQDLLTLYGKSERINSFGRIISEFNYLLAMERIEALQYHSAKDRYDSFLNLYPNLINTIPHHYIASYIGVAPESLSRIRKELMKSKS